MPVHWSIQQLTDFLSEVSGRQDETSAVEVAVERAAEALDAEVAAVTRGQDVRTSVGFGRARPPDDLAAAARRGGVLDVPGLGPLHVAASPLQRGSDEFLLVARSAEPLAAAELQMLHGMAQMLGLALRGIQALDAERALSAERERVGVERLELLAELQDRQRLVETLLEIQRAISGRRPLQDILDAVTAGASGLVGGWAVSLVVIEPLNAEVHIVASRHGTAVCDEAGVRAAGAASSSVRKVVAQAGRGPAGDRVLIAAPVLVEGEIAGSLVADLPTADDEAGQPRQLLAAFAQQVSLALTDARTVEAVREAFRDPLTGLATRALFVDLLEHAFAVADTSGDDLTVVYIDLDGFKAVNDTCGHQAGDELLGLVAARIRACLRDGDTAARLGGDEFVLLLERTTRDVGVEVAERIITAIRQPFEVAGREVFVAASAGVARKDDSTEDAAGLLASGDLAMYQAKQSGRGRVVVFEPAMRTTSQQRLGVQGDLRAARGFEQFALVYQPIVRLDTGEAVGVEALLRWHHPRRGVMLPAEFVPIAEETGMIRELGRWVLERSASDVGRWRAVLPGLRLNVNISARQIGVRRFPDEVAEILAGTGLPGHALTLELTETALMTDPESALAHVRQVRDLGVQISMDDFGTGYSALSYLRSFPVDEVKIDRSFVADINRSSDDLALVRAVVDLGKALRLRTVAEGIENEDQLSALVVLGCQFGQGHLLSRPLDHDAVAAWFLAEGGRGADGGGRVPRQAPAPEAPRTPDPHDPRAAQHLRT